MKVRFLIAALFLPLAAYAVSGSEPDLLRIEAGQLFSFDQEHPHVLPAHKMRALSIAIEFHDQVGSRKIMTELKQRTVKGS